jgi:hypothetical protein
MFTGSCRCTLSWARWIQSATAYPVCLLHKQQLILLRAGVTIDYSGLNDWIYWHLIHTTRNCRQLQRYRYSTHFTVHSFTRTRVLSLHYSYPGNGFISVSLSLKITYEDFFSQTNSYNAIILQLSIPKTRLNEIPLLPYPGRLASWNSTHFTERLQLNTSL